jgi:PPOX class probable F420-dependent enzyme
MDRSTLTDAELAFLRPSRTAVLATLDTGGRPRLVPICFVVAPELDERGRLVLHTPIDEKPKQSDDPRQLQRIQDLLILPEVTLLVDRWAEDWSKLAWLRLYGRGEILEPEPREVEEHAAAIAALREKYEQYRTHRLEDRPIIRLTIDRVRSWGAIEDPSPATS